MEDSDLPEDWDDYLKEMFKKLFGKLPEEIEESDEEELNDLKEKLLDFLDQYESGNSSILDRLPDYGDDDNKSLFVQDLTDEESVERFEKFIEDYDMELEIEFINDQGLDMVKEIWTNYDGTINISKVYEYKDIVLNELPKKVQMEIYTKKLETSVKNELYEDAAVLRDRINNLKDIQS